MLLTRAMVRLWRAFFAGCGACFVEGCCGLDIKLDQTRRKSCIICTTVEV